MAKSPRANLRHEAILEAAKVVFLEEGYQLASMDRIAERAGTTKRTVYDHFGSKEALSTEVMDKACREMAAALPGALPDDPRLGLTTFAARSVEVMGSPAAIRLQRFVAAEAERNPAFATAMREAMAAMEAALAAYLDAAVAAGRMKAHDTAVAARALIGAVAQATAMRGLFGAKADLRSVATVVDLFLRAHAA